MFSDADKERIRYHMGYLQVQPAASITYGLPVPQQTLFMLESSMDRIMPIAIPRVIRILSILDGIEEQMVCGQPNLAAESIDPGIKLRADQIDQLEHEYERWSGRLADIFGVMRYPFSERGNRSGSPGFHNVRVT